MLAMFARHRPTRLSCGLTKASLNTHTSEPRAAAAQVRSQNCGVVPKAFRGPVMNMNLVDLAATKSNVAGQLTS
jgi:hypothetical protein